MDSKKINLEKADVLPVWCDCGWEGLVLTDNLNYCLICKQCGKKILGLFCPNCESGFIYPEDYNKIDLEQMTWKCEFCGRKNQLTSDSLNNLVETYNNEEELPENVREKEKRLRKETQRVVLIVWVSMITIFLLIYVFFKFFILK